MVLIAFGIAALYMGMDGRATVRDSIKQEQIVFGAADDPAIAKYASQWADEQVTTGTQARAFAQVIHEHALEGSGGLTYAQMGRFVSADDPESPAGTSDEAAALKDDQGNPVSNSARDTWITATALSTALNMSYMAEQMALFGIVVGVALLLSGIGFMVLALGGALRRREGTGSGLEQGQAGTGRYDRLERISCLDPRAAPAALGVVQGESSDRQVRQHRPQRDQSSAGPNRRYEVAHESPGLELGVDVLAAPEPDRQQPHADDEVYVVLEGRGTLEIDGTAVPLVERQAVFVPAGADHRFIGYENLSVLVIFARPHEASTR